jgi:hypothetical protein
MSVFQKLPLPTFTERLYGFTIPHAGIIYACDHDESFRISLNGVPRVEVLDSKPYDFIASFDNALGIPGGTPLLRFNHVEVDYHFDGRPGTVTISVRHGDQTENVNFRTLSGDWFVATLSTCGKYLVLADPYLFECFEFA